MKNFVFETKQIPISFVKTEFGDFKIAEVLSILEDLQNTSLIKRLVIYNNNLQNWLLKNRVIAMSATESCYKAENYDNFHFDFVKAIDTDIEKNISNSAE